MYAHTTRVIPASRLIDTQTEAFYLHFRVFHTLMSWNGNGDEGQWCPVVEVIHELREHKKACLQINAFCKREKKNLFFFLTNPPGYGRERPLCLKRRPEENWN